MNQHWVGADPGGKGNFGLAFLDGSGGVRCCTVSSVYEAAEVIVERGEPLGIGIDAPMWWSARSGGGRRADRWIRKNYGIASGTVQSANSLQGAVLIGGVLLAQKVREVFPSTPITESHPKALLLAYGQSGEQFAEQHEVSTDWKNEHERDAVIAAVCAREGFEKRWSKDLAEARDRFEQDPLSYWLQPIRYFWPNDL